MLEANVLDYYHLREHLITAAVKVSGEGTPQARQWRKEMCKCILDDGPVELLVRIRELCKSLRSSKKRKALREVENYISPRIEMLNYPQFQSKGYQIGSGPTEAFCKTLTARLKGSGMRWDRPNAEAVMAISAVRASHLWKSYWKSQKHVG